MKFRQGINSCALLLSAVLLLAAWAVSSPVGSSADEDFHLASIWCAWGAGDNCRITESQDSQFFAVPDEISGESCYLSGYTSASSQSAGCLSDVEPMGLETTKRLNNVASYYPPAFYAVARLIVTDNVELSVISVRMLNALLAIIVIGGAVLIARPWIRRSLVAGLVAAMVPYGLFFIPSVNPSSWVIVGVSTFWVFFLSWMTTPRILSRRGIVLTLLGLLSLVMATAARSDGALFLIITTFMALLLSWKTVKPHRQRLLVLLIPVPFALWSLSFRFDGLTSAIALDYSTQTDASGIGAIIALAGNLVRYGLEVPALVAGALGANAPQFRQAEIFLYGIGSVDIRMPAILYLLTFSMFIAVVFTGLRHTGARKIIALCVGGIALLAVPLMTVSRFSFQYSYSPRYIYPLLVAFISLSFLAKPWRLLPLSLTQSRLLGLGFALANAIALLTTVRRYTNGQDETWASVRFDPEWWWAWGPSPVVVVCVGSIAGIIMGASFAKILHQPRISLFRGRPGASAVLGMENQ